MERNSSKKFPKISVYLARLYSSPEIPGNDDPFVSGTFQKIQSEFFIEHFFTDIF